MDGFKNILVVFNSQTDNQTLIEQVISLASNNQATITVIDVLEKRSENLLQPHNLSKDTEKSILGFEFIEEFPGDEDQSLISQNENWRKTEQLNRENQFNFHQYFLQEEQKKYSQFVSSLQESGLLVKNKRITGIPFIEIIREVIKNHHDLVMLTAEADDALKHSLFGNTTMHLMRKCPCPVWIVKPGQQRKIKRILAAVDLVDDDIERNTFAKTIVELCLSLAQIDNSELMILHAWSLFGESILKGQGGISDVEINKLLIETQTSHRQLLVELLQQIENKNTKLQVYLLKGNAGELIVKLAKTKEIDLLVMGTVSRGGIAGLLIGNTAESLLPNIDSSILTLKPAGFITPVKMDQ